MSLAAQIASFREAGSAARYAAYGQTATFRGIEIPVTVSAPEVNFIAGEGGDEIRVEQTCAFPISAVSERPHRWEKITLAHGRELVISAYRNDPHRGDYVCQLSNPGTAPAR